MSDPGRGSTCSSTDSFAAHGVDDGAALVRAAARALDVPGTTEVTVEEGVLGVVAAAYREAFRVEAGRVPPAEVEAALADAVAWTRREDGDRTLRVRDQLLPRFYRRFAGFHCAYHGGERPVVTE
ncbi:hypothetical protein [Halobaculum sp. EA56]|uniref:hypothetical protein n=1 Tax=Halobaculum sp. EA56 TaxID=3421648 RepID=UPI003EBCF818